MATERGMIEVSTFDPFRDLSKEVKPERVLPT